MRIGIFGTGNMAAALGEQWARAGHEIVVGGRDNGRAARLAERLGGRSGTFSEAADHGEDAVLLALPFTAAMDVVSDIGDRLRGRTVIDCSNPIGGGFLLETGTGPSAAERIAAAAPDAVVVKAFNLCHESVWRLTPPVFEGRPLAVPICGDGPTALEAVGRLVRDLGCDPLELGGLERAHLLEATAALLIGLWLGKRADAQAIVPPVEFGGAR